MLHTDFELAGGSTIGRDHRTAFRNCQDAYYIDRFHECTVAIVTDGCTSGSEPDSSRNELGARIGARLLAKALQRQVFYRLTLTIDWEQALDDMLSELRVLAVQIGNGSLKKTIQDYFLFTIVGALLTDETATFFALGDGIVFVNGKQYDVWPHTNTPPYCAYRLLEADQLDGFPSSDLNVKILETLPLEAVDNFLIGCDGVFDLIKAEGKNFPGLNRPVPAVSTFWTDQRNFNGNPDMISRQLRLAGRDWPRQNPQPGLLPDDTTLVVGRRNDTTVR